MGENWQDAAVSNLYIEADIDRLICNLQALKAQLGDVALMFVVKANAYGMGYGPAGWAAEKSGAVSMLGVTHPYEAAALKKAGVRLPIFVMGTTLADEAEGLAAEDWILSVSDIEAVKALDDAAKNKNKTLSVHIAVDTGMGRYGVKNKGLEELIGALQGTKNLAVTGVFSHLAAPLKDDYTAYQKGLFDQAAQKVRAAFGPVTCHLVNSEGAILRADARYQMVRVGNLAYGMNPFHIKLPVPVESTFAARSRVVRLFDLKKGQSVGYGRRYVAKRDMRCATLAGGNADGFLLRPVESHYTCRTALKAVAGIFAKWTGRRQDFVELNGQKCPILDASPVQQTVIDVTGKTVSLGDTVRLAIRRPVAGALIPRSYIYHGSAYWGEEALLAAFDIEK